MQNIFILRPIALIQLLCAIPSDPYCMKKYLVDQNNKSVYSAVNGRLLLFSFDDFIDKIVKGRCCFICGANPGSKEFNSEHIIPKWILKRYGTLDSFMILPNNTEIKNYKYLIPCCKDCNSELGSILENPMSSLLQKNYDEVCDELEKDEKLYLKIYHWAALIFFKTHLKDTTLLKERDTRKSCGKIGDDFCWECLFGVHNFIRHHYTGAKIADNAYGTVLVFESLLEFKDETFDYLDNLNSQTIMLQVGKIVIFVVLNDCRACISFYKTALSKITGPLATVQIRELFARLRYINDNLKYRPRFYTQFKYSGHRICVRRPKKLKLHKESRQISSLFKLMRFYIGGVIPETIPNRETILNDLEEGKLQYIFDKNFEFFQHKTYGEK